ncbi:MAG TPA: DinB family protein [Vicinamibacterales bacterium]|nr:DinB family protein [Vicinamibacterales bacterium]
MQLPRSFRSLVVALILLAPAPALAQGSREQTVSQAFDSQVAMIEREVLGLAQKMPADKYDFAPKTGTPPAGTFDGVRTFGLQVRHLATVMYQFSSQILGEQNPIAMGTDENGSDSLRTKEQIVTYLQDAIAYAHKAMRSITPNNVAAKASAAAFIGLHTYDHYGQMVVYARLNGVTPGGPPPTSAPRPASSR